MSTPSTAPDSHSGEFELIERYFASRWRIAGQRTDVILGIGDDAALLRVPEAADLVVSVDTLVAGRHFPLNSDARSTGHRSLAVNLSDMAAMGATPAWATLALTLPSANAEWLDGFASGLMRLAESSGVELVGGDMTAGPLTISIQILGHVERGTALRRSGGREGDYLAVTGTLGDAGAGLALATGRLATSRSHDAEELVRRFEYPTARVLFGSRARGIANAAMDLSDGLVGDLPKLASSSGLAAHVDVARLPLSGALERSVSIEQARDWALAAGDDYELLLAVPPHRFDDLAAAANGLNLMLTRIGELHHGSGVSWSLEGTHFTAPAHGYDHFR